MMCSSAAPDPWCHSSLQLLVLNPCPLVEAGRVQLGRSISVTAACGAAVCWADSLQPQGRLLRLNREPHSNSPGHVSMPQPERWVLLCWEANSCSGSMLCRCLLWFFKRSTLAEEFSSKGVNLRDASGSWHFTDQHPLLLMRDEGDFLITSSTGIWGKNEKKKRILHYSHQGTDQVWKLLTQLKLMKRRVLSS